jgi:hypothetical protein
MVLMAECVAEAKSKRPKMAAATDSEALSREKIGLT